MQDNINYKINSIEDIEKYQNKLNELLSNPIEFERIVDIIADKIIQNLIYTN